MLRARIAATGVHLPPRVETAAELATKLGIDEATVLRAGVRTRHVADEPAVLLGAHAARAALADGDAPDLLIWASATPWQAIPDTGAILAGELGLDGPPAFSVHATCLSFLVGLRIAAMHVATGAARRALVVSGERGTRGRDGAEPEAAALLGDAGAAALLVPDDVAGLRGFRMATWPTGAALSEVRGGGERGPLDDLTFRMNGRALYKFARQRVGPVIAGALEDAGVAASDIRAVIPHQPSGPTMAAWARVGFEPARVVDVIADTGNCVSASIGLALHAARTTGRAAPGDDVLLFGTGAGVSCAAAVWRL